MYFILTPVLAMSKLSNLWGFDGRVVHNLIHSDWTLGEQRELWKMARTQDCDLVGMAVSVFTNGRRKVWKLNFRQYGQMEKHSEEEAQHG